MKASHLAQYIDDAIFKIDIFDLKLLHNLLSKNLGSTTRFITHTILTLIHRTLQLKKDSYRFLLISLVEVH